MSHSTSDIIAAAERVFDTHGFAASGVDLVIDAAGVSSRTFYKHLGSKAGATVAVLDARSARFFAHMTAPADGDPLSVAGLFAALEKWADAEGSRGCLFLRAERETGGTDPQVNAAVAAYRARLRRLIGDCVAADLGRPDEDLSLQVLVLFEGATSAASYRGAEAVRAASRAAAALLAH